MLGFNRKNKQAPKKEPKLLGIAHVNGLSVNCYLTNYDNGRPAIIMKDCITGMPYGCATSNVSGITNANISNDYVAIKDHSENEGVYVALREAGIISTAKYFLRTDFVSFPICKIL